MSTFDNYKFPAPTTVLMDITPEIAQAMLATSPGNRRLRSNHVNLLAAAIRRGEWRVTNQGIGFNVLGELRDGHHRLQACIESGVTIQVNVSFGLPMDIYEVVDTQNIPRQTCDLINAPREVADVVRFCADHGFSYKRPTVKQLQPIMDGGLFTLANIVYEHCRKKRAYFSAAAVKSAACVMIMGGYDHIYILQQYKALCDYDFDSMSTNAKTWVRQVNEGNIPPSHVDDRDVLARAMRVFNKNKPAVSKITITLDEKSKASDYLRSVLRSSLEIPFKLEVAA